MTLTFLQYAGGQYWLLKKILERIPTHKVYCEVFGGSGVVLLNKKPSPIEVFNDIDDRLINLFEVLRDSPLNFRKRLQFLLWSRTLYLRFRERSPDPIEDAIRYFYLLETSFSGHIGAGFRFSKKEKKIYPKTFWNKFSKIFEIHERLKYVYFENDDFRKIIPRWDSRDTFFHLDPPYWDCKYYKTNFEKKDHLDLRDLLGKLKGKFLLTYNDHPQIRLAYSSFPMETITSQKAMSLEKKTRGINLHLFIRNYEVKP